MATPSYLSHLMSFLGPVFMDNVLISTVGPNFRASHSFWCFYHHCCGCCCCCYTLTLVTVVIFPQFAEHPVYVQQTPYICVNTHTRVCVYDNVWICSADARRMISFWCTFHFCAPCMCTCLCFTFLITRWCYFCVIVCMLSSAWPWLVATFGVVAIYVCRTCSI